MSKPGQFYYADKFVERRKNYKDKKSLRRRKLSTRRK